MPNCNNFAGSMLYRTLALNNSYRIEFVQSWVMRGLSSSDLKHSVTMVENLIREEKHTANHVGGVLQNDRWRRSVWARQYYDVKEECGLGIQTH